MRVIASDGRRSCLHAPNRPPFQRILELRIRGPRNRTHERNRSDRRWFRGSANRQKRLAIIAAASGSHRLEADGRARGAAVSAGRCGNSGRCDRSRSADRRSRGDHRCRFSRVRLIPTVHAISLPADANARTRNGGSIGPAWRLRGLAANLLASAKRPRFETKGAGTNLRHMTGVPAPGCNRFSAASPRLTDRSTSGVPRCRSRCPIYGGANRGEGRYGRDECRGGHGAGLSNRARERPAPSGCSACP